MHIPSRLTIFLLALFFSAPHIAAQQPDPTTPTEPQVPALDGSNLSENNIKNLTAEATTYADMPLDHLIKQIPELKDLQPSSDPHQLPMILKNTGRTVDDFTQNIGDMIAREDLTQEKLKPDGKVKAKHHVQDNYLILHHGYSWGSNAEYRMDDQGNRLGQVGLAQGFLVTAGHALSSIQFSTIAQSESQTRYRYLGTQTLGSSETYVLAFAQNPDDDNFATVMTGTGGKEVSLRTQGILWIDKTNFQILRMRSDLLYQSRELQLHQVTTDINFSQVQIQNAPAPLWLPNDVTVFIEIANERFRNQHHYTNYHRYQVAVKIGAS
jgi:hypothetical protein